MANRPLSLCLLLCAALAVGSLGAAPAAATVVVVHSLEEMTHRSDVVAHVVVRDVVVEAETPGRLITLTTVEVIDGVAGAKDGELLTVFQVGGEKDGRVAWIAGAHRFVVGEELVMFAARPPALQGRIVPWGIGFSLFRIVDDVDGRHVEEIGGDVLQLQKTADGGSRMAPVEPRRFTDLDAFKGMLRKVRAGTHAALPTLRKVGVPRRPAAGPQTPNAAVAQPVAPTTTTTTTTTAKE
jgi:hypothetical protein